MSEVHEEWEECGACLDDELNARWPIVAPPAPNGPFFPLSGTILSRKQVKTSEKTAFSTGQTVPR